MGSKGWARFKKAGHGFKRVGMGLQRVGTGFKNGGPGDVERQRGIYGVK
jgi:hypothetical protein